MPKTYTTVSGDMWDTVAYKTLGSEAYTDALIKLNLKHRRTYIFPAGVVLTIPEAKAERITDLPPWKKEGVIYGR
jgi:phage tail protein X